MMPSHGTAHPLFGLPDQSALALNGLVVPQTLEYRILERRGGNRATSVPSVE